MARPILVPQVGQDLTEGKLTALHVRLGDPVKKGDIVADVESEKATFEVEAFETGIVLEIRYQVGDMATVLTPLIMVGEAGEVLAHEADAVSAQASAGAAAPSNSGPTLVTSMGSGPSSGSSPLARRMAAMAGIDLAGLSGSGPHGAIVKRDIEAAMTAISSGAAKPSAGFDVSSFAQSSLPQMTGDTSLGMRLLQAGSGDPVIFIHGFGGDLSSWRPLLAHLSVTQPVLALDLPGHGSAVDVPAASFDDLLAALGVALAQLGQARLHLVGHSLGAALATAYAGGGNVDIGSLTLLSPAGLGPKINGDYVQGFLAADSEAALNMWLAQLVSQPRHLPGALARATLAAREAGQMVANQRRLAAGLFSGNTQLFSIRNALDACQAPVRVIVGSDDQIIPPEHSAHLPGHVGLHRIAQTGHLPQIEAAALTGRLISEAIRSAR